MGATEGFEVCFVPAAVFASIGGIRGNRLGGGGVAVLLDIVLYGVVDRDFGLGDVLKLGREGCVFTGSLEDTSATLDRDAFPEAELAAKDSGSSGVRAWRALAFGSDVDLFVIAFLRTDETVSIPGILAIGLCVIYRI